MSTSIQVLVHSDSSTRSAAPTAEHLTTVIGDALAHVAGQVMQVEAHLSDRNAPAKLGSAGIRCTLQAHLKGLNAVFVSDDGADVHQAVTGAVRKLRRAVDSAIDRHEPARHSPPKP